MGDKSGRRERQRQRQRQKETERGESEKFMQSEHLDDDDDGYDFWNVD